MADDDEQSGSALGTKEYWENAYENDWKNLELTNDSGEIWFGQACQNRMIKYLQSRPNIDLDQCRILDLGCGNGALTLALRRSGYKNIIGVDYAVCAIRLAQCMAEKNGFSSDIFQVFDILTDPFVNNSNLAKYFDILLDKGTYDAVGLMENGLEARQLYKRNVIQFIASNSQHRLLMIASCNSTKNELLEFFSPEFTLVDEIVTPNKIMFGGQSGNTVTTVVLQLNSR